VNGQVPAAHLVEALSQINSEKTAKYFEHCFIHVSDFDRRAAIEGLLAV
jgi:hypothetical protein